ncbi:glycosyltransferase family 9 protein [Desulfovibrio aminophilus]|uniref:glycosyltransferase family 9 protein n=1 Tax=Desulfovibrio aminophilus TaxID=81425 RepID=UPI00041F9C4E|nr:glycosyltransferase family 9 protein [Desulfovibrio aminophilus]
MQDRREQDKVSRVNVLVLSLTRFGDLLQTQPVFSGLKASGCRTGLVCLENFSQAAGLLRDLDHVAPLRGARLLARLEGEDWRGGLGELDGFLADLRRDFPPDVLVNLTPSLSARLLTRLIGAPEVRGFGLDSFGFNGDSSDWAAFLQQASACRGQSPFNVVDLFRRVAGLDGPGAPLDLLRPSDGERDAARALLEEGGGVPGARGFAALQLGASEDRRRWPVASFAVLARRLWAEHGRLPVLLGSPQERPLADRFRQAAPDVPCRDLSGRTELRTLAAALSLCDLLVTNDTGTMHLAAGLGVPVAAVFLATAQPVDTGPYRPGCLCLEPDLPCHPCGFGKDCPRNEECRRVVSPEAVLACVRALLEPGMDPGAPSGVRIWRTNMGADGFLDLESLTGHGGSDRARWLAALRRVYRRFLDGEDPAVGERPLSWDDREGAHATRQSLESASGLLHLLGQQAALLPRDPRPTLKTKFLANCERLQTILAEDPRLSVLGGLWRFQSQEAARDLAFLRALIARHHQLCDAFLILFR